MAEYSKPFVWESKYSLAKWGRGFRPHISGIVGFYSKNRRIFVSVYYTEKI